MVLGELRRLLTIGMTFGIAANVEDLANLAVDAVGGPARLRQPVRRVAAGLEDDDQYRRALDLAQVANRIAAMGTAEAEACVELLQGCAQLSTPAADEPRDAELEHDLSEGFAPVTLTRDVAARPEDSGLEAIVAAAAQTVDAQYASLFLLDEQHQELVFEVSLREKVEQLRSFRLPLGRGIAGLVAVTAQPIAVSDVAGDPRHAADIAEQTGYTPKNMLCVPLLVDDRVVGVLELLDKRGDDSFNLTDMQSLGGFLRQAAESIERSHLRRAVMAVLANELRRLAAEVQGRTAPSASELEWSDSRQRQSFEIGQLACDVASTPNIATTTAVLLSTFERYASSQVGRRG